MPPYDVITPETVTTVSVYRELCHIITPDKENLKRLKPADK